MDPEEIRAALVMMCMTYATRVNRTKEIGGVWQTVTYFSHAGKPPLVRAFAALGWSNPCYLGDAK